MVNTFMPKNAKIFHCEKCDFTCSKESNFNTHLLTRKHKRLTLLTADTSSVKREHICICGKQYRQIQGLSRHRRYCTYTDTDDVPSIESNKKEEYHFDLKEMFIESMQQNKELHNTVLTLQEQMSIQQQQIAEMIPKVGNTINNTNNITNNNNQFNLNFFLNEQCKDAIPLIDFVKSLQYDFDQLEYTGKHGFVEGVSKIIMDAMSQLDITKRPIHCTDVKRETFYVKDDESWKKEDNRNHSIKTAIHNIRNRNLACVPEWIRAHPNCKKIDDPNNDLFIEIIGQYMDAAEREYVKVVKTIAKSLTIPKHMYGRKGYNPTPQSINEK
jgi:hypothetical protein